LKARAIGLIRRHDLGGYNHKFANESVLVKVCRHDGRVHDICEREQFATLMGALLRVPVVDSAVIPIVEGMGIPPHPPTHFVQDRCVVMPLLKFPSLDRLTASQKEFAFQDFSELANLLCFMHWIGDEDRGTSDVFVVNGGPLLIDNGLCGPGRDSLVRSAHPYPERYHACFGAWLKKCHPGKPSFVAHILRSASVDQRRILEKPSIVSAIERLTETDLVAVGTTARLASWVVQKLKERQQSLSTSYFEWLRDATTYVDIEKRHKRV
jgi:hypothetical protein